MKNLLLIIIVAIEFNLSFIGTEHEPNWVRAYDQRGNEVELVSEQEKKDGITCWSIYDTKGNLITFLNFW